MLKLDKQGELIKKCNEFNTALSDPFSDINTGENKELTYRNKISKFFTFDELKGFGVRNVANIVLVNDKDVDKEKWISNMVNVEIPYYEEFGFGVPGNINDFIDQMFEHFNVKVSIDRQLEGTVKNGNFYDKVDELDITSKISYINVHFKLKFNDNHIATYISNRKGEEAQSIINTFRNNFSYVPQDQTVVSDMWQKVCDAHFENNELENDFIVAILKSFIWQIKRKTFNKDVKLTRMLILFGAQKFGKSHFFREGICGVFKDVRYDCVQINELIEGKLMNAYASPIIYFDELAYADKTDVSKLKQIITSNVVGIRQFHTQNSVNKIQRSIFCASSNNDVGTLIRDATGMRRFTQLTKTSLHIDIADTVDWKTIWLDIDENCDVDPLENFEDQLNVMQEGLRDIDSVEEFMLTDEAIEATQHNNAKLSGSFYESYVEFSKNSGKPVMNSKQFGMKVSSIITMRLFDMYQIENLPNKKGKIVKFIGTKDNVVDIKSRIRKA